MSAIIGTKAVQVVLTFRVPPGTDAKRAAEQITRDLSMPLTLVPHLQGVEARVLEAAPGGDGGRR